MLVLFCFVLFCFFFWLVSLSTERKNFVRLGKNLKLYYLENLRLGYIVKIFYKLQAYSEPLN